MNDAPSKDNPSSEPKGAAQTRPLWAAAGLLSLGLGLVGIFLPVLPTTPLVILAAFCFTRGSPRLRNWITGHGTFGPIIEDWEATGAIPQRVKFWACTVMTLTFLVSWIAGLPTWVLWVQAIGMGSGALYVLTRPDR